MGGESDLLGSWRELDSILRVKTWEHWRTSRSEIRFRKITLMIILKRKIKREKGWGVLGRVLALLNVGSGKTSLRYNMQVRLWGGKGDPGKCKGPEAGVCLMHLRSNKDARVTRRK